MRVRIYPYRSGSRSAQALKEAFRLLGYRTMVLNREDSRYRYRADDVVINWGSSTGPGFPMVNEPTHVERAASKVRTFRTLSDAGVPTVPWTTDPTTMVTWNMCHSQQRTGIYLRHRDQGHGGEGCEYVEPGGLDGRHTDTLPRLATQAVTGREYRIHVVNGRVIRVQKRYNADEDAAPVRSHGNGFEFISTRFQLPNNMRGIAVNAVAALGLDFGAVDLINTRNGPLVLEVNTAVGMDGSTPQVYAYALATEFIEGRDGNPD